MSLIMLGPSPTILSTFTFLLTQLWILLFPPFSLVCVTQLYLGEGPAWSFANLAGFTSLSKTDCFFLRSNHMSIVSLIMLGLHAHFPRLSMPGVCLVWAGAEQVLWTLSGSLWGHVGNWLLKSFLPVFHEDPWVLAVQVGVSWPI